MFIKAGIFKSTGDMAAVLHKSEGTTEMVSDTVKKYRILLVDDHPQFINAMKFILMDSFEAIIESIEVAKNGEECLDILETKMIDLIFMDIDMPVLNGIETTRRATAIYRDLRIIALSFHADMKYIIKMIEAGARSYIIKEEVNKEVLQNVFNAY